MLQIKATVILSFLLKNIHFNLYLKVEITEKRRDRVRALPFAGSLPK